MKCKLASEERCRQVESQLLQRSVQGDHFYVQKEYLKCRITDVWSGLLTVPLR